MTGEASAQRNARAVHLHLSISMMSEEPVYRIFCELFVERTTFNLADRKPDRPITRRHTHWYLDIGDEPVFWRTEH